MFACDAARAQEALPWHDLTRTAGTPQDFASFGYSGAAGRLGGALDEHDDAVVCAINEDEGSWTNVGAAFVFLDELLQPPDEGSLARLLPLNPQSAQQLGRLMVEIGNPRGSDHDNVILVAALSTTAKYCNGREAVPSAGSVEIYDFNDQDFDGTPALSLVAPLNAGDENDPCGELVPDEVKHFGQGLALADVTRNGTVDVIVGAPQTTLGTESEIGRIYVFAGHEDFLESPYEMWIGVNAPESEESTSNSGGFFGQSIAAACLTEASPALKDVVVGRFDRYDTSTSGQPNGGSAIVFRGQYLHDLFGGDTLNTVSDPVHLEDVDPDVPEYQVLANPFGEYQSAGSSSLWNTDWFGWFVFSVGDVGSPDGMLDGIDDIMVHAESTDLIGTGTATSPEVPNAGGNFVYFGTGIDDGAELVDPSHLLLMTPENVGGPQTNYRFGRAVARVDWLLDREEPLMDIVEPAIVISDPDATVGSTAHAGAVYLMRLPLPEPPADGWVPGDVDNAWGSTPLTEPGGPHEWAIFGGWILALDYWGDQQAQPGQQLLITARTSPVTAGATTHQGAGKFFTFTPREP